MTVETVVENCNRLCAFLKDKTRYDKEEVIAYTSPKGFLDLYGRILDYHGAPKTGWSWLYLTGADYVEMDGFCKENCPAYHDNNGVSFGFEFVGYKWYVNNK